MPEPSGWTAGLLGALLALAAAAAELDDPTRPSRFQEPAAETTTEAAAAAAAETPLHLTSILIAPRQRRVAVINNQVVRVGDRVAEAEVTAIHHNKVTLRRNDKTISLTLGLPSVKAPAASHQ